MMKENTQQTPLLDSNSTTKIYGTLAEPVTITPPAQTKNTFPHLDGEALGATCGAYVGEASAGLFVIAAKAVCAPIHPALALIAAATVGLGSATCTFFACKKGVDKFNQAQDSLLNQAGKPGNQRMKK